MSLQIPQANLFQRTVQWLAAKPLASKILARILPPLDRGLIRVANGSMTVTSLLAGLPVISLISIGARTQQRRTTFLVAIPHDDNLIVIASNFGNKQHPGWYINILSNAEVEVSLSGKSSFNYLARPTQGEEYMAYWEAALQIYPGYSAYKDRAAPRRIPVIVLSKT